MHDRKNLLVKARYEVFGERDSSTRTKNIAEIWTEDCLFLDPDGEHYGRIALNKAVQTLQDKTPGFVFSERGPVNAHHNVARLFWAYGPANQQPVMTGMDIAVFNGNKIQKMYTFLD